MERINKENKGEQSLNNEDTYAVQDSGSVE
jgi:hypothetical protein